MKNKGLKVTMAIVVLLSLYVGIRGPAEAQGDFFSIWLQNNTKQTSDSKSLRVEFANTVADFDAKTNTDATNTVETSLTTTHDTSGTPAAGIGASIDFVQETAASNNEIGARIAARTTDVTAGSEDFTLDFMTMAGGAAAATKMSMGSTGVLTLAGGGTIDNVTNANNLAITETNIGLNGATTVTGALVQTGAVTQDAGVFTVNEAGDDYDFRVESADTADALKVDAGLNTVIHGAWNAYEYKAITDQSYSLASTGKASYFKQTVGADGTFHLMTELLTSPGAGTVVTIKTGDANDITIDTEGSETIDGAATYVLDGTKEAVTLITDGVNWDVMGGYLE
jgi:hypothetical protein